MKFRATIIALLGFLMLCGFAANAQNPKQMKKHKKSNKKKQKAYKEPLTYDPNHGDKDGDGILDYADHCANTPKGQAVTPFGCPIDRDFDGTMDSLDRCPDIKGPKDNQGCPWPDSDNDGLLDKDDACPETAGPKENKGCPWADRDKDGIIDKNDHCPDQPGIEKWNGCPDTDNDQIPDNKDNCPDVFGVPENRGCPEIKAEVQKALQEAFDNLLFESGKAIIKHSSYESLNSLAKVMKENTNTKLHLEGHTDNVGDFYENMTLSEDRAAAVRAYLIKRHVPGTRITTSGFGETKPVETNDTPEGRQANRRVEMILSY